MLSEDKEGVGTYARRSTARLADREGVESCEQGLSTVGIDLMVASSSFWRGVLWGKASWCYSLSPLSWYLSLFLPTSYSSTLWYVLIRLGTFFDSLKLFELFFYRTLTRAVLVLLLPDGMIPVDSFVLTLIMDSLVFCPILSYWTCIPYYSSIPFIMDSLVFCPILSYRTRIPYYSSIPSRSMEFYAYASLHISRQLHVLLYSFLFYAI